MNKNLGSWVLSIFGFASVTLSFVLIFSTIAKAYCSVNTTCSNGAIISCGGDTCHSYGDSVKCTTSGKKQIVVFCE